MAEIINIFLNILIILLVWSLINIFMKPQMEVLKDKAKKKVMKKKKIKVTNLEPPTLREKTDEEIKKNMSTIDKQISERLK